MSAQPNLRLLRPDFDGPEEHYWARLSTQALADPQLTDQDVRVLGAICQKLRTATGSVQITNAQLALATGGRTTRAVQLSLRRLENAGYLRAEPLPGPGHQRRIVLLFRLRGANVGSPPGANGGSPPGEPTFTRGRTYVHPGANLRSPPPPVNKDRAPDPFQKRERFTLENPPSAASARKPGPPPTGREVLEIPEPPPSPADLDDWERRACDRTAPPAFRRIAEATLDRFRPEWRTGGAKKPAPGSCLASDPGPAEVRRTPPAQEDPTTRGGG